MSTPDTLELLGQRYGTAYRWLAAVTVLLGMLSSVLTTTVVNVAVPDIMGTFGMGQDHAHWLSTGALAGTSVAMLMQSWLVGRFGLRATFISAMGVLLASLLLAAHAPDENVLILARLVQGSVMGLMQPIAVFVLISVFPPDRKGQAMGMFGLVAIVGPAMGPGVGGIVIEYFNWRAIFYVSVPIASIALLLGSIFLPQRAAPGTGKPVKPFDWLSFTLVTTSIFCLLVALSTGQRLGWNSSEILLMVGVALVCGVAFVLRELRVESPLVEVRTMLVPDFAVAILLSFLFGAGLFGSTYLIPLFAQTVQSATPSQAGLILLPGGLLLGLVMPISGYLADRMAARTMIVTGILLFMVSSFALATVGVDTSYLAMAGIVAVGRVAVGAVNPSLNVAAISALPAAMLAQGAGLINFARQLGGAFGVNGLSVALEYRMAFHSDAITAAARSNAGADLLRGVGSLLAAGGAPPDLQSAGALHYFGTMIAAQAYSEAFRDIFYLLAIVFAIALLPALVLRGKRAAPPPQAVPMDTAET